MIEQKPYNLGKRNLERRHTEWILDVKNEHKEEAVKTEGDGCSGSRRAKTDKAEIDSTERREKYVERTTLCFSILMLKNALQDGSSTNKRRMMII